MSQNSTRGRSSIGRREFLSRGLLAAGYFAATACTGRLRPRVSPRRETAGRYLFPQGLASGDPTPHSVVLWTRVEARDGSNEAVDIVAQLAPDPGFESLVLELPLRVGPESDHTLRLIVDGLDPDSLYYYRFIAGFDASDPIGRTRTAPQPDADRSIRLAFGCCQNFEHGYFGAYRRLVDDDKTAPEDEQIDFVLHLGDFIYECVGSAGVRVRSVPPLPSGGLDPGNGVRCARTLDDYRHLYRTYLSDPDLRAARARWPFVCTWDDHEFSDDCWQSRATYGASDTPAQRRKLAANQAWFEYVPALLTGAGGAAGVEPEARDFKPTSVEDAPFHEVDAENRILEPNNRAAIGSITIYRSLRFGRHVELVLSDTRSYRSDHAVPEELAERLGGSGRGGLPVRLIEILDAGREHGGASPPDSLSFRGHEIPNPRRSAPPGTMLGPDQRAWWKATMRASRARWKLWANSVPCLPLRFDYGRIGADDLVLSADSWDGYPSERRELMRFLLDHDIRNVVSLSGDHHAHFCGMIMEDFEADAQRPVAPEFCVAGFSSESMFQMLARIARGGFEKVIHYDATRFGGSNERETLLNLTFLDGVASSLAVSTTGDLATAGARRNPRQNRHLAHVDSDANGYGLVNVTPEQIEVTLVSVAPPLEATGRNGARILRSAHFRVRRTQRGERPALEGPKLDGAPPFPLESDGRSGRTS